MKTELTPAQKDAIEKAYSLLGEHFDESLIAVCWEATDPNDDDRSEAKALYYKGGFMAAVGLAAWSQHILLNQKSKSNEGDYDQS